MTQALAFWRLKEAEEALRDDKHPIFSFQVSINGGRKFRAFTKEELWKFYETLDTRYYYEVLRPNNSCKVYFDLEYEAGQNEEKNGHEMVKLLIELANKRLWTEFGHSSEASDVLVLESYYKTKFSSHLVFLTSVFDNNQEVGGFVEGLISSLSEADRLFFTVNHNGQKQLFIDTNVYRLNQQFRLFNSRKMGRMNPLIISPISTCKYTEFNQESFFASLVTNVDSSVEIIKSQYHSRRIGILPGRERTSSGETYAEVDSIIKEIISPGGRVTGWTYHAPSETFCYSIENYNFCRNVNRSHSNAKIYFLYCVKNHSLWQQCFSQRCRNYKSDPITLPDFGWADMEPWDE